MKNKILFGQWLWNRVIGSLAILAFLFSYACSTEPANEEELLQLDLKAPVHFETWQDQIDWLTQKSRSFHNIKAGMAQGWSIQVTDYWEHMGYHYLNPDYADGTFEFDKPETLLYAPDGNGGMKFVAVEYLIFVADPENPGSPPEGFIGDADVWEYNADVEAWTLHAWIGMANKDGIFAHLNYDLP